MSMKDKAGLCIISLYIALAISFVGYCIARQTTPIKAQGEQPRIVVNATLQRSQPRQRIAVINVAPDSVIKKLNQAIVDENFDEVKKIVAYNPEIINQPNEVGEAAIHIAVTIPQNKENGMVEWLIKKGSDVNLISKNVYPQWRPIYYAINDPEMVKILVAKGADIKHRDGIGRTLLHISSFRGTISQVVEYSKLYDINATDNGGQTPLHYVCKGYGCTPERLEEYPTVLKFLVKNGADIEKTDRLGRKPLYYTLLSNDNEYCHGANYEEALKLLIMLGADVNNECDTKNHKKPLQIVREKGLKKHEKILLQHGANL